jgi:hypothetical protein
MLFHPEITQVEEFVDLVKRTVLAADTIEDRLLNEDKDPSPFGSSDEES